MTRITALRHAGEPTQVIATVIEQEPAKRRRGRAPILVVSGLAVVLLGYVVAVSLTGGGGVGAPFDLLRHDSAATTSTSASPTPGGTHGELPSPAGKRLATYPLAQANSFDPLGDHSEEQSQAHYAIDNDPATAWYTERYFQADFGKLKPGVGLLVDAGTAVAPSRVTVDFLKPGTTFEIRSADTNATTLDAFKAQTDATIATTTSASVTDHRQDSAPLLAALDHPPAGRP